jgi:DNA polymerase-3 subunit delta'
MEEALSQLMALKRSERIVSIVEQEKAFSVSDAQLAIEKAYLASDEMTIILLGAKVFSPVVQNKLLKVIEEPPHNTRFILVTQSQSTILDTIKSRLPMTLLSLTQTEEMLGLEVSRLSLQSVYDFTQTHKRTPAKEMVVIVERIAKEAMHSGAFELDEKTLKLFSSCYEALDMGSPPQFVLNTLLLKLLARKKR